MFAHMKTQYRAILIHSLVTRNVTISV